MLFEYSGYTYDGQKVYGIIEAESEDEVVRKLSKTLSVILSVRKKRYVSGRKISQKDLIAFTSIMSIALSSGLSVVKSLEIALSNVKSNILREVISMMIKDLKSGLYLSESMSKYKNIFNDMYISLVKTGENTGKLGETLSSLSDYLERSYNISSKIKSSLVYPVIVLLVALGVIILFMTSIVPRFAEIYSSYNTSLPVITQITISVGNFIKDNLLLLLALIIAPMFVLREIYRRSENFRRIIQLFLNFLFPPIGSYLVKGDIERFSRIMSLLIGNGVNIMDALSISSMAIYNVEIRNTVLYAFSEIQKGERLSKILSENRYIPNLLVQMILLGEETGKLSKTLQKVSDFYILELERESEVITSTLSPLVIVFVGLLIGFLVLSLFLPMFNLQQILIR